MAALERTIWLFPANCRHLEYRIDRLEAVVPVIPISRRLNLRVQRRPPDAAVKNRKTLRRPRAKSRTLLQLGVRQIVCTTLSLGGGLDRWANIVVHAEQVRRIVLVL